MWICGAGGMHNKEAGILEEIQLENQHRNPTGNYAVWDGVLYGRMHYTPGLTTFLNTSCTGAKMEGDRIVAIEAWQLTSQTWLTIHAKTFIDASGDSILAAVTPAEFRMGRESSHEFGESIQGPVADDRTMGNSLLVQLRRTDESQPFIPPPWAYKFETADDLPHRIRGVNGTNFWWLEVGGLQDTIREAEPIRDELYRVAYGVWDYIKNKASERDKAENWALEWVGALPGKRESRRMIGDHILTANDIRAGGEFDDIVAYGGWSMDDHHPAGIYYPGKPTIFHPAPSPYGIPYRCLYSRNVSNLLFAGRNISVTHAALSSTRVMATCALLGQAAGTAAALGVRHNVSPRGIASGEHLRELQAILMDDDCWLPGLLRPIDPLAREAKLQGGGEGVERLLDGLDRDREDEDHAWKGEAGCTLEYRWERPVEIGSVRMVFDSNLQLHKRMPCSYPHRPAGRSAMPGSLVKEYRVEIQRPGGAWETVVREEENLARLVHLPIRQEVVALRLTPESTWGDSDIRIFAFEPQQQVKSVASYPDGPSFSQVRSQIPAADLEPPQGEIGEEQTSHLRA